MYRVDPYAYLSQVSARMNTLKLQSPYKTVLDEVEYLFEVIPPNLKYLAKPIIEELPERWAACS
jgi:hypothetical protein